jgi:uncharacterized protein involved in exopolysaccharide biosynthesis
MMAARRSLDLSEVLGLLWHRKLAICLAGLVGGASFVVLAYTLPSLYRSQAQIVVRGLAAVAPDPQAAFNAAVMDTAVVTTEKQVLSSPGLLSQVARRVAFPPGLDLSASGSGRLAALLSSLSGLLPAKLRADWGVDSLLRGLIVPDSDRAQQERRLQAISRAVRFESDPESSVVGIIATTPNAQFSADIVNTVAEIYMKERLAAQSSVASNAVAALRERLHRTQTEIAAAEQRVATLLQEPGLLEEAQVPGESRELSVVGSRLAAAKSDLAARRAGDSEIEAMQGNPFRLVELLDESGKTSPFLRQQYVERQQQLVQLGEQYGPEHPAVLAVERQIQRLRGEFSVEAQRLIQKRHADLAAAEKTVTTLSNQYSELQRQASGRSGARLSLDQARAQLESLRQIANNINDRITELVARPVDPNARIISAGAVPLRPEFPNKSLFAVSGAALASFSVVLFVFGRAYKSSLRLTPADGAQLLPGPFLGALPRIDRRLLSPKVLFDAPRRKALGTTAATFDGIALQVEDLVARQGTRVLTITSGRPDEGKTTVASILAVTLANFGKRVLLVNCDLHAGFSGMLSGTGANWRAATGTLPSVMLHEPTGVHVLDLTNRMADAPLNYLRSAEFREILRRARTVYDLVLCDTPPVLAVPDPLLVAKHSDGVLLVAEHEHMGDEADAGEITRRVALSGKPICGIIVTKASGDDAGSAAYTGYGYESRLTPRKRGAAGPPSGPEDRRTEAWSVPNASDQKEAADQALRGAALMVLRAGTHK